MSTDSSTTADLSELAVLPPARFTAEQYVQMIEAGVFDEGQRVELIHGIITPMTPPGPDHSWSTTKFPRLFAPALDQFELAVQSTLNLGDGNVLDPDFMLLKRRPDGYKQALPGPDDVALLIESAASSLQRDMTVKLAIYAAAGINEYWILDLQQEALHVYRRPQGKGFEDHETLASGVISPLTCPDITLEVRELFA